MTIMGNMESFLQFAVELRSSVSVARSGVVVVNKVPAVTSSASEYADFIFLFSFVGCDCAFNTGGTLPGRTSTRYGVLP